MKRANITKTAREHQSESSCAEIERESKHSRVWHISRNEKPRGWRAGRADPPGSSWQEDCEKTAGTVFLPGL